MPSRKLSLSQVPSNMDSCKLVTHAVDNIDWENKSLNGDQTHHTNSIIIQESTDSRNDIPSVALNPDYNFERSEHNLLKVRNSIYQTSFSKDLKPSYLSINQMVKLVLTTTKPRYQTQGIFYGLS